MPDVELSVELPSGVYRPKNYDERFHGPVRLREALGSSYNVPAVHVALRVSEDALLERLRALYGKPFTMWKFRTMHTDAEARRTELEAHNEMDGPVFKIKDDPRIFAFGRWLRRMSIDELPQLINVLRGEMSLVGPRPLPVYEINRIEKHAQRRRLSVKPGLTCLWQVTGRNGIKNFDEWVALDLKYIDNWSLWLDVKILAQTVPAVLRGAGAS